MMRTASFLVVVAAVLGAHPVAVRAQDADGGPAPKPIEPRVVEDADDAGTAAGADAGPATLPGVTLTARIEPDPVAFGAPFDLVIDIVRDRGLRLTLPGSLPDVDAAPRTGEPRRAVVPLAAQQPADAGAADAGAADAGARPAVDRVRETIRIPFIAGDVDNVKTPAFALTTDSGAQLDVLALPVRVTDDPKLLEVPGPDGGVQQLQPGQIALEPHAPVLAYSVPDRRPFVGLAGRAVLALLALAVRRLLRMLRARPVPPPPPPPPRPAHEVALERLDALLASGLLARGEAPVFVTRLMDEVLRDYLTARFALSAGTRTTRELVADLLGVAVAGLDVSLVESLLKDTDLVKFARAAIASEHAHAMALRVRTLIEATRATPPGAP